MDELEHIESKRTIYPEIFMKKRIEGSSSLFKKFELINTKRRAEIENPTSQPVRQ